MIPDIEISLCPEHEVKSRIGTKCKNEKILEEKFAKIYEIDAFFSEHYKEKIQVDKNDCQYILFRIDVYFTEYYLAVEIYEKGHTDRDVILEKKRQEALEKNLNVNLLELMLVGKIMINSMKLVQYKHLLINLKKMK